MEFKTTPFNQSTLLIQQHPAQPTPHACLRIPNFSTTYNPPPMSNTPHFPFLEVLHEAWWRNQGKERSSKAQSHHTCTPLLFHPFALLSCTLGSSPLSPRQRCGAEAIHHRPGRWLVMAPLSSDFWPREKGKERGGILEKGLVILRGRR